MSEQAVPDPPTKGSKSAIDEAARRLMEASSTSTPCPPVRDLIGFDDISAAYAVQQVLLEARSTSGAMPIGRKIGLTSPAVQRQLGVDTPDLGILFDDMAYQAGASLPIDNFLQPRVEAEIAFVLRADLIHGPLDTAQIRDAVAYATAALEFCDSRIVDWDITFGDTVADNASAGAYVLGDARRSLEDFEPREVAMVMTVNGTEVSRGRGSDCLGDPLNAVMWLARQARELGSPLRAGEVVLSGALGPMAAVAAGDIVEASITGFDSISATLSRVAE
ncbi:2-keto-4-pentenoate hydratase [Mycolicibacterium mucogenicum]|uniref:2-keto-4-pentenoate hydratase n=2 Tax=Mycolicibacterium mucogenicum TaxID=56689 RepID=A0A1A3H2H1_MYCMU|nr:2-keto-4-pentenoate hydratase [Mycolicibacterium mucogenicum]